MASARLRCSFAALSLTVCTRLPLARAARHHSKPLLPLPAAIVDAASIGIMLLELLTGVSPMEWRGYPDDTAALKWSPAPLGEWGDRLEAAMERRGAGWMWQVQHTAELLRFLMNHVILQPNPSPHCADYRSVDFLQLAVDTFVAKVGGAEAADATGAQPMEA